VGPRAILSISETPEQWFNYILILPGFGIISQIICHKRGKKEAFRNLGTIFGIL
jgi:hypothetical protein